MSNNPEEFEIPLSGGRTAQVFLNTPRGQVGAPNTSFVPQREPGRMSQSKWMIRFGDLSEQIALRMEGGGPTESEATAGAHVWLNSHQIPLRGDAQRMTTITPGIFDACQRVADALRRLQVAEAPDRARLATAEIDRLRGMYRIRHSELPPAAPRLPLAAPRGHP